MAWTTPRTHTAGSVLAAAHLNETRDNLKALLPLDQLAWTSFTPTLTQSATITKTLTYAKWNRIANEVRVVVSLNATSAGTANNAIVIGLPVAATTSLLQVGTGRVFDASGNLNYPAVAYLASTTTIGLIDSTAATSVALGQTGSAFSTNIATGDDILYEVKYEVA